MGHRPRDEAGRPCPGHGDQFARPAGPPVGGPDMTTALEVELKTYAHDMVADHVKEEYDSQIRSKWQPMINQLVDGQAEALRRHQEVLDKVRKQKAEQLEAIFGLSMLALSFVAGPLLSWISGKIQYSWFPKYK